MAKNEFFRSLSSSSTFRQLKQEAAAAVDGVMYDQVADLSDDVSERAGSVATFLEQGLREIRELEALASNHGSERDEDYDASASEDESTDEVNPDEPRTR